MDLSTICWRDFGIGKKRLLERWGDKERNGCSVVSEGHLLRGGPTRNTAGCQSESHRNHWRWTGKKWQAHKNSSCLYLCTMRIGGLFTRLGSVEACAVVERMREKYRHWNYSLTDNCQIDYKVIGSFQSNYKDVRQRWLCKSTRMNSLLLL